MTVLPILRYHIQILRWAYINRSKYSFLSEQKFIRILWYARRNLSNRKLEVRHTCTKPWAKFINNYETIIIRNINNQGSILSAYVTMLSLMSNNRSFKTRLSEDLVHGITDTLHQHTTKGAQKYEQLPVKQNMNSLRVITWLNKKIMRSFAQESEYAYSRSLAVGMGAILWGCACKLPCIQTSALKSGGGLRSSKATLFLFFLLLLVVLTPLLHLRCLL